MSVRKWCAAGALAGALLIPATAAGAQESIYVQNEPPPSVAAVTEEPAPQVPPQTVSRTETTLPVTGGDILGMVAVGSGAIVLGTVLVRRRRPATQ